MVLWKPKETPLTSVRYLLEVGLCSLCGSCIAACSWGAAYFDFGRPSQVFLEDKLCVNCSRCLIVCPQAMLWVRPDLYRVAAKPVSVLHARSKDERISSIAQDGGTITSMVVSALEKKIIDAAILAGTMGRWTPKPTLALTPRDALECAKSKYFYIPSLLKLGRDADAERIMIVGLPCQIRAVERLAELGVGMTHKVTYKLGLLCSHNVDYESMTMKLMMQRGINADRIVKMDIKGKLLLHDVDNKVYEIPLSTYEKLVRPSCHQCPEFLSSFSDINVGSRGALNGWNTVLVMNERGEKLFNEVADALETKQAEERVIHEVYKTDKRKKERAAEFFRDFYGSEVGGSFLDNETLRVISRGRT